MRPCVLHLVVAVVGAWGSLARAQGLSVELQDVSGGQRTVTEAALRPDWRLVGKQGGADANVDLRDLVSMRWNDKKPPAVPKGPLVLLTSGEVLGAEPEALEEEQLRCRHPQLGQLTVPLSAVRGLVFDVAGDSERNELVRRAQTPDRQADRVVLQNGDVLSGVLLAIDNEKVRIELQGNPTNVDRDRIAAVTFNASLSDYREPQQFFGQLRLAEGSLVFVKGLVSSPGNKLQLATLVGPTWTVDATEVVDVVFRNGRVVYLSDLDPATVAGERYLDGPVLWRRDRSVLGGPLAVGGRFYAKGLGVQSHSRLSYAVEGFSRFEALAGLDATAGPLASVRFRVELDGKSVFDSGEVVGNEPKPIALELAGAKTLSLVVEFASRGDVQDYANWCNARLIRN